jgi:hypothetical protein
MDNRVKMGVVGGIALVAAAAIFHFMSSAEEADTLDDDLMQLGDLKLDAQGNIEFEQFLKIF